LVAGQRAAAEERDSARGGAQRAGRYDRGGTPVAGSHSEASADLARVALVRAPAGPGQPRVSGRAGRARHDPGGARSKRWEHLGDRADAGAHASRSLSEAAATWPGIAFRIRSGYSLSVY